MNILFEIIKTRLLGKLIIFHSTLIRIFKQNKNKQFYNYLIADKINKIKNPYRIIQFGGKENLKFKILVPLVNMLFY